MPPKKVVASAKAAPPARASARTPPTASAPKPAPKPTPNGATKRKADDDVDGATQAPAKKAKPEAKSGKTKATPGTTPASTMRLRSIPARKRRADEAALVVPARQSKRIANQKTKAALDAVAETKTLKVKRPPPKKPAPAKRSAAKNAAAPEKNPVVKRVGTNRPMKNATGAKRGRPAKAEPTANAKKITPAPKKSAATEKVTANRVMKTATGAKRGRPTKAEPKATATKKTPAVKKAPVVKKPAAPRKPVAPKPAKVDPEINPAPTQKLSVFVFGENSAGELGLGSKNIGGRRVMDVKRPRHNENLEKLGVVYLAVGGMHCAALTADNKIYTWGVNDGGALGRITGDNGKMIDLDTEAPEEATANAGDEAASKNTVDPESGANPASDAEVDADSDSDSDDEDSGLNPDEAEPREVDPKHFAEGTKFASLHTSDSATFALTTTGKVYGWGQFRANDGPLGFRPNGPEKQETPVLIPELNNIKDISCGTNHVLALDHKGKVFVWGAGEQSQLGRRVVARTSRGALLPREFGFQRKKIVNIASGDYHSFAIEKNGNVYAWGLNSFAQTGIPIEDPDDPDENQILITLVKQLKDKNIKQLAGGAHHTVAVSKDGDVMTWGRIDNAEGGMEVDDMPKESVYFDQKGGRYLKKPLTLPGLKATYVATANDTCLAIGEDGIAYSWGFSENFQTGQGQGGEVITPTPIANTAVSGKKIVTGGVGGQFGMIASAMEID